MAARKTTWDVVVIDDDGEDSIFRVADSSEARKLAEYLTLNLQVRCHFFPTGYYPTFDSEGHLVGGKV